jgi:hypothetical protein
MQRLFVHPVVTPFFFIFGLLFSQFGYAYLKRGSFQYTSQRGLTQIISPATNAALYWTITGGLLTLGVLFVAIGAYAAVCLVRARRTKDI